MNKLFHLQHIEESLKDFKKNFHSINDTLAMRREPLTDIWVDQILEAYSFLNSLLLKDMDLFTPAGLYALLEMNHLVLCGSHKETRAQYYSHLEETRKSFLKKIRPIKDWVLEKKNHANPWKLATGYYSRSLSQPQLFIEGNHRTGNIILNYLLISKGEPPYVITPETAKTYLDLSGEIKFTDKDSTFESALRMPGYRKKFQKFLKENTRDYYLK